MQLIKPHGTFRMEERFCKIHSLRSILMFAPTNEFCLQKYTMYATLGSQAAWLGECKSVRSFASDPGKLVVRRSISVF